MRLGFFYLDPYYMLLVIPAMIIALIAQGMVSSTFNKYSRVHSVRGITGEQAARQILETNGVYNVRVERVSGRLNDHYDPRSNVIRLSDSVYSSTSVASIGVAAHEAGHALQYDKGYVPIKIRAAIVPVTQFGSQLSFPLILIGAFMQSDFLINLGLILFSLMALFQLITLPVEFNASARALRSLGETEILYQDEIKSSRKVLTAAAMTYVAALIVSIAQLLRLLLLFGGRRRDQ